jgi:hypothetical protein
LEDALWHNARLPFRLLVAAAAVISREKERSSFHDRFEQIQA